MSAKRFNAKPAAKKTKEPEKRAPGWQIRCLKCEVTAPWSKPGVRLKARGRTFIFSRCPHCKRIRLHAIEKIPTSLF